MKSLTDMYHCLFLTSWALSMSAVREKVCSKILEKRCEIASISLVSRIPVYAVTQVVVQMQYASSSMYSAEAGLTLVPLDIHSPMQ